MEGNQRYLETRQGAITNKITKALNKQIKR